VSDFKVLLFILQTFTASEGKNGQQEDLKEEKYHGLYIDYRCDDRRFWLSAHDCQVPTPTSQNLDLEQQIRICEAD
jgi:hypothetical protein